MVGAAGIQAVNGKGEQKSGQIDSSGHLNRSVGGLNKQSSEQAASEECCPRELLPTAPKPGYITFPDRVALCRMTRTELTTLPDFTISNEHGSIKFITPPGQPGLDLTGVDLGRDITILPRRISVYDDLPSDVAKPLPNTKLNVPSIITLNRVAPRKGQTPQQQEDKLRQSLEDGNARNSEGSNDLAEFIFYDHRTYEWVFKVPHYTTWGDSEEEEEEVAF